MCNLWNKSLLFRLYMNLIFQFSNIEVSRRFKHFDWLHERLEAKYALIPIPPLPGKQFAGNILFKFMNHVLL